MTILFIPVYDDAHPMMPGAGAGNGNDDLHWFSDPDSHPAVRPRRAAQPAAQPAAPSSAGARVESYAPPGGGTGVAQMAADGWHRG